MQQVIDRYGTPAWAVDWLTRQVMNQRKAFTTYVRAADEAAAIEVAREVRPEHVRRYTPSARAVGPVELGMERING